MLIALLSAYTPNLVSELWEISEVGLTWIQNVTPSVSSPIRLLATVALVFATLHITPIVWALIGKILEAAVLCHRRLTEIAVQVRDRTKEIIKRILRQMSEKL
jgi:hypothetical protein